jgi:hypothetical protein
MTDGERLVRSSGRAVAQGDAPGMPAVCEEVLSWASASR